MMNIKSGYIDGILFRYNWREDVMNHLLVGNSNGRVVSLCLFTNFESVEMKS